jgi:hypothetical protein
MSKVNGAEIEFDGNGMEYLRNVTLIIISDKSQLKKLTGNAEFKCREY